MGNQVLFCPSERFGTGYCWDMNSCCQRHQPLGIFLKNVSSVELILCYRSAKHTANWEEGTDLI